MRQISSEMRRASFAQETNKAYLVLLEITHQSLQAPIRVVNDFTDKTYNGNTYIGFPFNITLPADTDEAPSNVTLIIDNVDRQMVDAIRRLQGPPTITIMVGLATGTSVIDSIEAGPFNMTLRSADYDAQTITATIAFEDMLNEPYPGDYYTPTLFPGLF